MAVALFFLGLILMMVVNVNHYYLTHRPPNIRRAQFFRFLIGALVFVIGNMMAFLLAVRFYMLFHHLG